MKGDPVTAAEELTTSSGDVHATAKSAGTKRARRFTRHRLARIGRASPQVTSVRSERSPGLQLGAADGSARRFNCNLDMPMGTEGESQCSITEVGTHHHRPLYEEQAVWNVGQLLAVALRCVDVRVESAVV
jgi:hypothetical protein